MPNKITKANGHIVQSDWGQNDPTKMDYIHNKPDLFSGDYDDLTNKPTIPDVPSAIEVTSDSGTLTAEQLASIKLGSQIILTTSGESVIYTLLSDMPWSGQYIFIDVKGYAVLTEQFPQIQTFYHAIIVDKTSGSY